MFLLLWMDTNTGSSSSSSPQTLQLHRTHGTSITGFLADNYSPERVMLSVVNLGPAAMWNISEEPGRASTHLASSYRPLLLYGSSCSCLQSWSDIFFLLLASKEQHISRKHRKQDYVHGASVTTRPVSAAKAVSPIVSEAFRVDPSASEWSFSLSSALQVGSALFSLSSALQVGSALLVWIRLSSKARWGKKGCPQPDL